jgi:hypothetical protein
MSHRRQQRVMRHISRRGRALFTNNFQFMSSSIGDKQNFRRRETTLCTNSFFTEEFVTTFSAEGISIGAEKLILQDDCMESIQYSTPGCSQAVFGLRAWRNCHV